MMNINRSAITTLLCPSLVVACASAATRDGVVEISVVGVKERCSKSIHRCLAVTVHNSSQKPIEIPIDGESSKAFLVEPNYSYQGLKKEGPPDWEPIALSIGTYNAPNTFKKVPPGEKWQFEVYFPEQMPTAWVYSKFRIDIIDRAGMHYYSNQFDSKGKLLDR